MHCKDDELEEWLLNLWVDMTKCLDKLDKLSNLKRETLEDWGEENS